MKPTQTDQILSDLLTGVRITALDALKNYGCFRLAARIGELRKEGFPIKSETVKLESRKYVTSYFIQP